MRQGFTLIEVIIVTAISVIVLFGVFGILQASNKQLEIIHTKMSLEENLREAMFKMAQEIRQTTGNRIENIGGGGNSGATIDFWIPVPDPTASALADQNFQPAFSNIIRYRRTPPVLDDSCKEENQLCRDDLTTGKHAILANDITDLHFSRPNAVSGFVTMTASAQRKLSDGRRVPEEPIQTTMQVQARNTVSS